MAVKKEFELVSDVGSGEVDGLIAKNLLLHLSKLLLRYIDLSENQRNLLRDEGNVLVGGMKREILAISGRVSEGVNCKEIGGDYGNEHENVER